MFVSIHSTSSSLRKRGSDTRHHCIHSHSSSVSASEPCSLSLQRVSLRLEQVSVALPRQLLFVVLRVLGYTTLLRKIRVVHGYIASLSASLRPVQNRLAQPG